MQYFLLHSYFLSLWTIMNNYFLLCVICSAINSLDVSDFRKHYGLSFHNQCHDYVKTFKCLSVCKSIGYQVFRLNSLCKCSCHEMKTTTVVPYFKWRTNGTPKTIPKTFSPQLYHIVGTLYTTRKTQADSNKIKIPKSSEIKPDDSTFTEPNKVQHETNDTTDITTSAVSGTTPYATEYAISQNETVDNVTDAVTTTENLADITSTNDGTTSI